MATNSIQVLGSNWSFKFKPGGFEVFESRSTNCIYAPLVDSGKKNAPYWGVFLIIGPIASRTIQEGQEVGFAADLLVPQIHRAVLE